MKDSQKANFSGTGVGNHGYPWLSCMWYGSHQDVDSKMLVGFWVTWVTSRAMPRLFDPQLPFQKPQSGLLRVLMLRDMHPYPSGEDLPTSSCQKGFKRNRVLEKDHKDNKDEKVHFISFPSSFTCIFLLRRHWQRNQLHPLLSIQRGDRIVAVAASRPWNS